MVPKYIYISYLTRPGLLTSKCVCTCNFSDQGHCIGLALARRNHGIPDARIISMLHHLALRLASKIRYIEKK